MANDNEAAYYQYIWNLIEVFVNLHHEERPAFFENHAIQLLSPTSFSIFTQQIQQQHAPSQSDHLLKCMNFIADMGIDILLKETDPAKIQSRLSPAPNYLDNQYTRHRYRYLINTNHRLKFCSLRILQLFADHQFNLLHGVVKDPTLATLLDEAMASHDDDLRAHLFQRALSLAQNEDPSVKAPIHFYLATALSNTIKTALTTNLEAAIGHFKEAEKWFTRERSVYAWAKVQNGLAGCYGYNQKGDAGENIETAIGLFYQALEGFDKSIALLDWAMVHNNLGSMYTERVKGDKQTNINHAIAHFKQALTIQLRELVPDDWAVTTTNLGIAYTNNTNSTERTALAMQAIELFEQVCDHYTQTSNPFQWALLQAKIGNAYNTLGGDSPAMDVEKALHHFQLAVRILNHKQHPQNWANTLVWMGSVFMSRIRGERAVNVESAIRCFKDALVVITMDTQPYVYAHTHMKLANAYLQRLRGNAAANQRRSIRHLKEALTIMTKEKYPMDWASIQHLLGNFYKEREGSNKADDYERAIQYFKKALLKRTPQSALNQWGETINNLAWTYTVRIKGHKTTNHRRAIALFEEGLVQIKQTNNPQLWCRLQYGLGSVYAVCKHGDRRTNQAIATNIFKDVLTLQTPDTNPIACFGVAYKLGDLFHKEALYAEALEAFRISFQSAENLRAQSPRDISRRQIAAESVDLFRKLVSCCVELNKTDQAFFYTSAAKARMFSDKVSDTANVGEQTHTDHPAAKEIIHSIQRLRQEIDEVTSSQKFVLTAGQFINKDGLTLLSVVSRLRKQLAEQLEELSFRFPQSAPAANAPIITPSQVKALSLTLADTALVEYYQHDNGWGVFLASNGKVRYVHLPEVTYERMNDLFICIKAYEQHVLSGGHPELFNDRLKEQLAILYRVFVAPMGDLLPAKGKLVLAPSDALGLLPLHIAWNEAVNMHFIEEHTLSFVPSLGAFYWLSHQAKSNLPDNSAKRLLSVMYPGQSASLRLKYAKSEADLVANHFADPPTSTLLANEGATVHNVLRDANKGEFDTVHMVCHGSFNPNDPEHSGLHLCDGVLTAERIQHELSLRNAPMVILSACQTGQSMPAPGDEVIGLVNAFLVAGAQTVIASQWSVNDASTLALFKHYFYLLEVEKMGKCEALRAAMFHVRTMPGWEYPIYWAAFTLTGLSS